MLVNVDAVVERKNKIKWRPINIKWVIAHIGLIPLGTDAATAARLSRMMLMIPPGAFWSTSQLNREYAPSLVLNKRRCAATQSRMSQTGCETHRQYGQLVKMVNFQIKHHVQTSDHLSHTHNKETIQLRSLLSPGRSTRIKDKSPN